MEERGAQLCRVYDKKNGNEILWEGKEPFWRYHAPILFPIVGRVANNEYRYGGKTYSLPQHGFARVSDFAPVHDDATDAGNTQVPATGAGAAGVPAAGNGTAPDHTPVFTPASEKKSLRFRLDNSEKTREVYPFSFRLQVEYLLEGRNVTVRWTVTNPSQEETMYFSIGAHPAFRTPLVEGEAKNEYFVRFEDNPAPRYILFNKESGLAVPGQEYVMDTDNGYLQLKDHLFDIDTFIFQEGQIRTISLCRPDRTPYLRMHCAGFPYFGLWTQNDDAPFVCLEPWYGRLDDEGFTGELPEKTGIQKLAPGATFEAAYTIEVL